ncbi:hypothetical protein [Curtobacterium sp. MCBD17_040]|uniref:competence protein CoiA family protein n=1 Tax=Curtobacterium sp. MCBD17_040 TaxID=2175674 RepID=UPI000DA8F48A|nr:hypothetical protein [Curtobacterium sp. MCBD17_040]WIB65291.1 hypothetical protein DEI94_17960 [Curtobacterium sp. MCBD17_040]
MPLTAHLDGTDLVAPLVPAEEWQAMKGRVPRPVLACGMEALAKTSVLGTPFFAHKVACVDFEHKGESPNHFRVKAALVEAATTLGWTARPEVRAADGAWVADVLAERDGRRVAFEVQLAGQTADDYLHRQRRYERDGVECFWLTSRANTRHLEGVPALHIDLSTEQLTVSDRARTETRAPLTDLVAAVLTGDLRWTPVAPAEVTAINRWGLHICTGCETANIVWRVRDHEAVGCSRCSRSQPGRSLPPTLQPRKSAAALGVTAHAALYQGPGQLSQFACHYCGRRFPPFLLWWLERGDVPVTASATVQRDENEPAHWCSPTAHIRTTEDVLISLNAPQRQRQRPPELRPERRTAADLLREAEQRRSATSTRQREAEQREAAYRSVAAERNWTTEERQAAYRRRLAARAEANNWNDPAIRAYLAQEKSPRPRRQPRTGQL